MAFVTADPRVKEIIDDMRAGEITRGLAAEAIRVLPPQKDAAFGYLDWEVAEALRK